ncbi:gliding motility-associated C-terminal domain-containing protein [Emticicia sp. BO119]|uniref:T9SS type B sorting domain-containing protein n=1 Tax=Emticicia sp. BO119 TaxID=2757768 RepID=UPI0015F011CD|nr:gliding motility-associated C-terminal domain-containing protein [Emticicia sp. BO119]MBA4853946.1 gliding motility-associated C-terminal domain-containing protein [Emticicia sp. BO119]
MTAANGIEVGNFDATVVACVGQQVDVKDLSGGTNIKYVFGYSGQAISALPGIPAKDGPNADWAFAQPANYIVLQYGKKNGKDMYACKVVTVRATNKPDVSYEACNNSILRLTIRDTPANNYTSYRIKWSDGSIVNVPVATVLPYTIQKSFPAAPTQNVLVEGFGSTLTSCPAATPMTIIMDRGDMFPRIEKIDLNEAGTEATITLEGNPDAEYNIFSRSIDQQGNLANPLPNKVKAGTFKMPVTDKTKSQCFLVARLGTVCSEYSNEVCTMPFKLEASDDDNKLTWNGFTVGRVPKTAAYTNINQSETKIIRSEDGTTTSTTFNNVSSPFLDDAADCNKKYCYTLSTKVTSSYAGYTGSTYIETAVVSQTQCIDRKTIVPDALTETVASVNDNNTVKIDFRDNSNWKLDIEKYRLHQLDNSSFEKIDSIPSTASKNFLDGSVDASKESYCYAIDFIDKCGSTSALSPSFCTIFLSEASKNELVWTDRPPFGDTGIDTFEVESYDEHTGAISTVISLAATQLKYIPNLSKFEEEAKFRIKTTGSDGTISYSNIYTMPVSVKLLLPDAFTPNNDGWNDNLEVKGTFRRIANFDFQIYNRWGNPVFSSDNPLRTWDGSFQGTSAPVDTYTYKIYAKLFDGTEVNKTGRFLLIR